MPGLAWSTIYTTLASNNLTLIRCIVLSQWGGEGASMPFCVLGRGLCLLGKRKWLCERAKMAGSIQGSPYGVSREKTRECPGKSKWGVSREDQDLSREAQGVSREAESVQGRPSGECPGKTRIYPGKPKECPWKPRVSRDVQGVSKQVIL
jgi:hypothetical protein